MSTGEARLTPLDVFLSQLELSRGLAEGGAVGSPTSSVSSATAADAVLTPPGTRALLEAFAHRVPHGTSALDHDRPGFVDCMAGNAPPTADPRWAELFGHAAFVGFALWAGAYALAESDEFPAAASPLPAGRVVAALEARFVSLLRRELARFWAATAAPPRGAKRGNLKLAAHGDPRSLHTVENLALVLTLSSCVGFFTNLMARLDAARAIAKTLAAMFRRTRTPGERELPSAARTVDDYLIEDHWRDSFWSLVAMESMLAAGAGAPMCFDPAREFPSAPLPLPEMILVAIPPLAERPAGAPIPADVADWRPPRCRDYLGFLDPLGGLEDAEEPAESVARRSYSDFRGAGPPFIGYGVLHALYQVAQFVGWLRDEAGLSMIGLLVAEDARTRGGHHVRGPRPPQLDRVLRAPLAAEAIRRRRHLWDALVLIEESLPPELSSASAAGDLDAMLAALAALPGDAAQIVMAALMLIRQLFMMLVSPEPFADLVGPDRPVATRAGSGSTDGDTAVDGDAGGSDLASGVSSASSLAVPRTGPKADEDALLRLWISSPSFFEASRSAVVLSSLLRALSRRILSGDLGANLFLFMTGCASATHAAWLHLLVLRLHASLPTAPTPSAQAAAAGLHAALHADVDACASFLDASVMPQYKSAALLLRSLQEHGDPAPLGPDAAAVLRFAQRPRAFCGHGGDGDGEPSEGACFACLAGEGAGEGDPIAGLAELGLGERPRRTVRFGGEEAAGAEVDAGSPLGDGEGEEERREEPLARLVMQRADIQMSRVRA